MKKVLSLFLLSAAVLLPANAQDIENVKPVKNVIVMIPDGTSTTTVSLARWMQWYSNPNKPKLNIDPYICGSVRTHSSNAPIGDSAPTTSCYMTGYPQRTGNVSTYPLDDPGNDIYPMDHDRAYQPLTTVLEAVKQLKGCATGLVFTCEFPHATPADCSAHSYNRGNYRAIAPQMAHNNINVVLGGGTTLLPEESEAYLKGQGYGVFKNDINGMRNYNGDKMWALYGDREMDYDLDRDPLKQPSLEEMTRLAIKKLSKENKGFFLMVEGSKIDWAAHANDPAAMYSDMLAFDRACGAALEFARQNGETAVVIMPDHSNSGISIGRRDCKGYDKLTKDQLFYSLSLCKRTAEGLVNILNSRPYADAQKIFSEYAGFELTAEELEALKHCKDYKSSPLPEDQRSTGTGSLYSSSMTGFVGEAITKRTCLGFTTGGHTGEEVFLAAYHPDRNSIPVGMHTNVEMNHYICSLFGLSHDDLETLTAKNYAPHTEVFKDYTCEIVPAADEKGVPTLVVKNKKKQVIVPAFSNLVTVKKSNKKKDQEEVQQQSVNVYSEVNNTFYVPTALADYLK